jgi:hypothetical protein
MLSKISSGVSALKGGMPVMVVVRMVLECMVNVLGALAVFSEYDVWKHRWMDQVSCDQVGCEIMK